MSRNHDFFRRPSLSAVAGVSIVPDHVTRTLYFAHFDRWYHFQRHIDTLKHGYLRDPLCSTNAQQLTVAPHLHGLASGTVCWKTLVGTQPD